MDNWNNVLFVIANNKTSLLFRFLEIHTYVSDAAYTLNVPTVSPLQLLRQSLQVGLTLNKAHHRLLKVNRVVNNNSHHVLKTMACQKEPQHHENKPNASIKWLFLSQWLSRYAVRSTLLLLGR